MSIYGKFLHNPVPRSGNDQASVIKPEIFLDGKVDNLVQRNLVRLMLYRFTSVDFCLRAPVLIFYISGRLAELFLREAQSYGSELCN